MLKGEAKTRYMRDYMRRKRAGENRGTPPPADAEASKAVPAGESARRIRELESELRTAKMQLLMAQTDLRRQMEAGAQNPLVLGLQAEIKTLKGKLAHEKAQAIPPSEREARMRKTMKQLGERLRKAASRPPIGTLIMSRRDKLRILKCLHPDKRSSITEKEMTQAAQLFNGLKIREP